MRETLKLTGTVLRVLGNNNYEVEIDFGRGRKNVLCYLAGKMCQFRINVVAGDEVQVQLPYPYERGRITYRGKK